LIAIFCFGVSHLLAGLIASPFIKEFEWKSYLIVFMEKHKLPKGTYIPLMVIFILLLLPGVGILVLYPNPDMPLWKFLGDDPAR